MPPKKTEAPIQLTPLQEQAVDEATSYLHDDFVPKSRLRPDDFYSIGGYAGTGKTTLIKSLVDWCTTQGIRVGVCAFTGKAASVLESKGIPAQTIHRTIYQYNKWLEQFIPIDKYDFQYDCLIIDEASMVSKSLWNDLRNYDCKIIAVGDPAQLEPIGQDINLVSDPDITLTEIHRQAQGNPIIDLSMQVRKNIDLADEGLVNRYEEAAELIITSGYGDDLVELGADVILCGRNDDRIAFNQKIRDLEGFSSQGNLLEGERIIFLQNDYCLGVYNGLSGTITNIIRRFDQTIKVRVICDDGKPLVVPVTTRFLGQTDLDWKTLRHYRGKAGIIDYGYALTVHKSQGSEWDRVAVFRTLGPWSQTRWDYTAVTRAAKELFVLV